MVIKYSPYLLVDSVDVRYQVSSNGIHVTAVRSSAAPQHHLKEVCGHVNEARECADGAVDEHPLVVDEQGCVDRASDDYQFL